MSVIDTAALVASSPHLNDGQLEHLIDQSDIANAKTYFGDKEAAKGAVRDICTAFVEHVLNNPDPSVVPIRKKTKYLLVLNNFALYRPIRGVVFQGIKNLSGIFEDSMKKEGTMPFDSELGRMSEHVLVLMMRVLGYKFKAAQVHEFAEGNTQFAVQLLLAVLLKEPPYEFELRCNCISGLLGFTQPQAYFDVDEQHEFHECTGFTEKVDFILSLMIRLAAFQVVNDVISLQMSQATTIQPLVHVSVTSAMRCAMNIFKFCSHSASQWRQHLLLSTTFVDGAVFLYVLGQTKSFQGLFSVQSNPQAPREALTGLALAFRFTAFATFHMGSHARALRPLCSFFHDLLAVRIHEALAAADPPAAGMYRDMYVGLFVAMINVDALSPDTDGDLDLEGLPELSPASLEESVKTFLLTQVRPVQGAIADWSGRFSRWDDGLIARDSATYQHISAIFASSAGAGDAAAPVEAPAADKSQSLLGNMPSLMKPTRRSTQTVSAAPAPITQNFVVPTPTEVPAGKFCCALNGHTMKTPVTSPYGHHFERDTILQWLRQQGPVCPITGKPLHEDELTPNTALQAEIMREVIKQSMRDVNHEDEADLYDF